LNQDGEEERMGEVIIVSLVGMVVFGGLFILLCPEWWSNNLGTIKEKPADAGARRPEADKQATPRQAGEVTGGLKASEQAPAERR
jgi:hypothetical protein